MISLYVCDFPQDIDREELEPIFSEFDGFIDLRLAKDKNG